MENLTPEQRAAVENRGGSLLVSAAAGSGKTKVLVDRLFRYVTEEGRNLDDFLIITYTRAAAAELRGRIASELSRRMGENPGDARLRRQVLRVYQADIKTVDAFCAALLRENTHLLSGEQDRHALTADFRVLDDGEAALLRERVLRRVLEDFYGDLSPGRALLADTMGAGRDDSRLAALVLEVYGKLQSHAYPLRWLNAGRKAWENLSGAFDNTVWAAELLNLIHRKGKHFTELLRSGSLKTEGDEKLSKAYGEKFLSAAFSMEALTECGGWEAARQAVHAVRFPRLSPVRGRSGDPDVLALKQVWKLCKDGVEDLKKLLNTTGDEAVEDLRAMAPAMDALLELTALFSEAYRAEKLRMNVADFPDQEHLALKLLTDEHGAPTELGRQVSGRYAEILVDEYQDTNEVQNAIFRAVSRSGNNLFTVGDVKQSIYRFRLADPGIFLEKYARFVPWENAEDGQNRKILLSKNFRSRREVLSAANFVFSNILSPEMGEMSYGAEEALYFGAEYYPERNDCAVEFHLIPARRSSAGEDAESRPVRRLTAEARFTAARVRELLDGGFPVTDRDGSLRPCRPEDMVILMRSPASRLAAYYLALTEQEIPCSFEEAGGFFETMEISTVLSLLEITDNPRQDVPLISVLRSPVYGFSPDRLAEIRAACPGGDYYDALCAAAERGETDCTAFLQSLTELRQEAQDRSVYHFLWYLYDRLNLPGIFAACDRGEERKENLSALTMTAARFEGGGYRGLFAFVTQLRRLMETGRAPEGRSAAGSGGVRLMSIHRSKGLEFPVVILTDLDHGFSRQDFNTPVLVHPDMGLGPQCADVRRRIRYPTLARTAVQERLRRENLAEEQRILYVAMTRPREKLILVDSLYGAEGRLQALAAVTGRPVPPESVAEAKSFGDWILLTLLSRPEAEPLRRLAGVEAPPNTGDAPFDDPHPWQVFVHDSADYAESPVLRRAALGGTEPVREAAFDPDLLSYAYPYERETAIPAKVTATQLKGRVLDDEIAENAARTPYLRPLEQPKFRWQAHGLTPAERGTAAHLALQYLDFSNRDAGGQIASMVRKQLLTEEQAAAVDVRSLNRFLSSSLAEEIRRGRNVRREYPFTLLMDAAEYGPCAGEDRILLQGVVDCCFETDAGVTVVDFKTDHVWSEAALSERAERYRSQLAAYSQALERVLEKPVVRRVLYFLEAGRTVEL